MQDASLKKISLVSLAALFVLFIGAIIFYKERVFFTDSSYILFNIIVNKTLAICEHRYGSFVTQMVPLLALKLHLPIKVIIVGYAISFNLFYLVVITLLIYRYKQYMLAVLMSFYYFLFISQGYFWMNDEIHQAVAWMFLFFGVILSLGKKKAHFLVLLSSFLVLAWLTIFTHFVVIIPLCFLWFFLWFRKTDWPFSIPVSILFTLLLAAIFVMKYFNSMGLNSYDNHLLAGATEFSLASIGEAFSKPEITAFLDRCLTNYWAAVIIFIAGIVFAFRQKQPIPALLAIAACAGYFAIMGLTFGKSDGHFALYHIESEWASLSIIIGAPFVFFCLPHLRVSLASGILVVIFLARLYYMSTAIPMFAGRYHFKETVRALMIKKGITKLALYNDNDLGKQMVNDWAISYETILRSAAKNEKPQTTFIIINRDDKENAPHLNDRNYFAKTDHSPNEKFPPYLQFDTTKPYQVMTFDELNK